MSTPKTELPHKPVERIRRSLRKDYDFSEDQAAGTVMAVNDAIELVLDDLGQFKAEFVDFKKEVNSRFDRLESGQRWHLIGIYATLIGVGVSITVTLYAAMHL